MFVVQAGVALSNARERERLTERVRLDQMITSVAGVRHPVGPVADPDLGRRGDRATASAPPRPGSARSPSTPRAASSAPAARCRSTPTTRSPSCATTCVSQVVLTQPPGLVELGVDDVASALLPASRKPLQEVMRAVGASAPSVCPFVSQDELVGYAVLGFAGRARTLSNGESDALLEVGRLLGQIVRASRVLETEQRLVQELRELARYRSELIATISHELKTPLTAILGHAELVADRHPELSSIDAIIRNAQRLATWSPTSCTTPACRAAARPCAARSTSPSCARPASTCSVSAPGRPGCELSFHHRRHRPGHRLRRPRGARARSWTTWSTTP